jgi:type III pantothenate kinase
MLLAVDIGNTHTGLGVFQHERLLATYRLSTNTHRSVEETWAGLSPFLSGAGIAPATLTGFGISSVVPQATATFQAVARQFMNMEAVTVSGQLPLGISILYDDPDTLGADRICNAVAGFQKYGGPLIIIDLGTATTYDVVNDRGDFLGGPIALGLGTQATELHRRTAQLPAIDLAFPSSVIARDTRSAMQAGVVIGGIEALEGIVRRIRQELGQPAKVIATGGLSQQVASLSSMIDACEPYLVLEGVRLIVERLRAPQ